jgi:LuxR family maltose regulon positive regulatory protein
LDATSQQNGGSEDDASLPGFEIISHRTIQLNVWTLQCALLCLTNRGSQAVERAQHVADALPKNWLFVRGNTLVYLGLSMAMDGQYSQAVEMLTQKYESLQKMRTALGKRILFSLATIYLLQGELELCRQTAETLVRNAKELNFLLMLGWGYYMLGRVYQEWNQLDLAVRYYKLVIDIGYSTNLFCALESIAGYVYVLDALDQHELAQEAFVSLQNLFEEQMSATTQPIMALRAWLKLKSGNRIEARRWANSFGTPISQQAIVWYHIPHFYKAKIQMEINSPETTQEIDHFLDEAQELAVRTHNIFTQIRTLAMRSVWFDKQGERLRALQTLERAIRLGYPGGFMRTFIEQGLSMQDLLQAIAPNLKNETGLYEYVITLIDAFSIPGTPHSIPANLNPIKTLLTGREHEILELLAERLSIHEISNKLHISPSTVQQHTHHIYRKLNVNNKRQAVASAELLGILPGKA